MQSEQDLRSTLRRIDGKGYKAYKDLRGSYAVGSAELFVDHVQGDPFAAPSKVRVRLPQARARLPKELFASRVRRVALEDFLARRVRGAIRRVTGGPRGSGKSGMVAIDAGAQEVLERSAVRVTDAFAEARLEVGLPAAGRRVLGREAEGLLAGDLPKIAEAGLAASERAMEEAKRFVEGAENQEALRTALPERGLVAFVGDGAILPRASGASDRPLTEGAVPFEAPEALRVEIELPNPPDPNRPEERTVRGLGVPEGVTLVVGGGYHGKSTLLKALERAVYPHVPGDGRELVATVPEAVKIRAEDGRRVEACDISPFIDDLPHGRSTRAFASDDASGSTSQAANIVEALELGARALLLDEDTSATNFMVRDARMQELVHKDHEPITPFVDRVRELYDTLGVSTVLVMGGCGDYFDVADTVIEMHEYAPRDATEEARKIAAAHATHREAERGRPLGAVRARIPQAQSLDPSKGKRDVKIDVRGRESLGFGETRVDLRGVEQIVDASQTRAIGNALVVARERLMDGKATLREILAALEEVLDEKGIDALDPFQRGRGEAHPGNLARPRPFEIGAALNRLRTLRMRQS